MRGGEGGERGRKKRKERTAPPERPRSTNNFVTHFFLAVKDAYLLTAVAQNETTFLWRIS